MACLSPFAGRDPTLRLASIWTGSPVAGLRPMRRSRFFASRIASPLMRTPASSLRVCGDGDHEVRQPRVGRFLRQGPGFTELPEDGEHCTSGFIAHGSSRISLPNPGQAEAR